MNSLMFTLLFAVGCGGILISFVQARSRAVFSQDGFARPARRAAAVGLLALVLLLTVAIPFAGGLAGGRPETKSLSLVSLFAVHGILLLFLFFYYELSRGPSVAEFLKIRSSRPIADLSAGVLIGFAGWLAAILALLLVAAVSLLLRRAGVPAAGHEVSHTIAWIVSRPVGVRIAVVLSAMVVEELFFRSFLQTRVGPLAATLMFTAAHGVYGQPWMLLGILVLSAILSATFVFYGNVLPCIAAHGTFDAIQMFVLAPLALKPMAGG